MRFTDRSTAALKPKGERYEAWEDGRTGFGIRVSLTGRKSWLFMYRFDGRARRMTLGVYPTMPLVTARLKHAEAKKLLSEGIDPGEIAQKVALVIGKNYDALIANLSSMR